jgi:hypothetical protein
VKKSLDALPYVIGHRLGPARAGEDAEGRTNGLGFQQSIRNPMVNEQEMIREFIVHGYLLADTRIIPWRTLLHDLLELTKL